MEKTPYLPWALALAALFTGCRKTETPAPPAAAKSVLHPLRLDGNVAPLSEELLLAIDPDSAGYSGKASIALDIRAASDSLRLHAVDFTFDEAVLEKDGHSAPLEAKAGAAGLTVFRAREAFGPGKATLRLAFRKAFSLQSVGLYKVKVKDKAYIFSQFEAWDARGAFPCFDEPGFKIPWKIAVRIPSGDLAVGNYPVESEKQEGKTKLVAFAATQPMPSYLVALSVGDFDTVSIAGMSVPGRIVCEKGKGRLASLTAAMAPKLLGSLEDYFGGKMPYPKLDLIAVPEFMAGAMENPGAITFRDGLLLLDSAEATAERRRRSAYVMAHEMSHLWFGDLVTMAWWDDLWLNESFASWMGDRVVDKVYPEFRIDVQSVGGRQWAMTIDAMRTARAIRTTILPTDNPDQSFDALAYDKGQEVLGMLEAWLGAENFRAGIRAYLGGFAWKNARGADLWEALSKAAGRDVAGVMAGFLDQPGVPLVAVERRGKFLALRQSRFLLSGQGAGFWKVPVVLRCGEGDRTYRRSYLLDSAEAVLADSGDAGLCHPNDGERGYYRWVLDSAGMDSLAAHAAAFMTERERFAFVGDLSALADAGRVHYDELLKRLSPIAQDPSPLVLGAVIAALDDIDATFIDGASEAGFAGYLTASLAPALDRIGWQARAQEDELIPELRAKLLRILADKGRSARAGRAGDSLAALFLKDRRKVDPALARAALQIAAARGGVPLFKAYRRAFETAETPAVRNLMLLGLSAFRNPAAADSALAYALTPGPRNNEFMALPNEISSRREHRGRVLNWMTGRFPDILKRRSLNSAVYLVWFASHSEEEWEKAKPFFKSQEGKIPGLAKEMDKVEEEVRHTSEVRRRDGEAVKRLLSAYALSAAGTPARR
jgi:alanyl aminopeptidase